MILATREYDTPSTTAASTMNPPCRSSDDDSSRGSVDDLDDLNGIPHYEFYNSGEFNLQHWAKLEDFIIDHSDLDDVNDNPKAEVCPENDVMWSAGKDFEENNNIDCILENNLTEDVLMENFDIFNNNLIANEIFNLDKNVKMLPQTPTTATVPTTPSSAELPALNNNHHKAHSAPKGPPASLIISPPLTDDEEKIDTQLLLEQYINGSLCEKNLTGLLQRALHNAPPPQPRSFEIDHNYTSKREDTLSPNPAGIITPSDTGTDEFAKKLEEIRSVMIDGIKDLPSFVEIQLMNMLKEYEDDHNGGKFRENLLDYINELEEEDEEQEEEEEEDEEEESDNIVIKQETIDIKGSRISYSYDDEEEEIDVVSVSNTDHVFKNIGNGGSSSSYLFPKSSAVGKGIKRGDGYQYYANKIPKKTLPIPERKCVSGKYIPLDMEAPSQVKRKPPPAGKPMHYKSKKRQLSSDDDDEEEEDSESESNYKRSYSRHSSRKQRSSPNKRRRVSLDNENGTDKRSLHNSLERMRRVGLKNLFDNLRRVVPGISNRERTAKVVILNQAMDTVRDCTLQYNRNMQSLSDLKNEQHLLRKQLSELRKSAARHR